MNEEERIKALQYEIESQIKNVKKTKTIFVVHTTCGIIIADNYRFGQYFEEYMDLYRNETFIACINIWNIEYID
jgi:hypothetical protein